MATTAAVLDILIRANTGHATANLKKTDAQLRKTDDQTKKSSKSFALLGTAAKAGGLALGAGLAVGLKKAHQEAREAAKVGRQTNAVLKSTGGAAKVSKKEIEGLAEAISEKSGMDDEAIQSAENLLLTFTKVRNETGRGNKIFNQATSVITDMSVALDQDLKSSTIQVGKALNDPIKGITALRRVGVSFTTQQQEQIKAMVESGNVLGAQKKILRELTVEFGGSAAAQADGLDRLKVTVNNLLETLGGPLNTALNKAATATSNFLLGLKSGGGGGMGNFGAAVKSQFNQITAAAGITSEDMRKFGAAFSNVWNAIRDVAARVAPAIRQIMQGLARVLISVVRVLAGVLTADFGLMWRGVKGVFSGAIKTLGGALRGASAPFRAAAVAAFGPIKSVVSSVFNSAKKLVGDAIAAMLRRIASLLDVAAKIPGIGGKFKGVADRARDAAAKIDGMGESVKRLPKNKTVNVRLKFKVPGVGTGELPGFGGPQIDTAIQNVSQDWATRNKSKFAPLFEGVPGVLGTAKGTLGKYERIGHRFGLRTTSGFRPGDPGYHGQNRARDLSDGVNTPGMMKYARHMAATYGSRLLELIYTPLGFGIKHGKRVPLSYWGAKTNAAHHNHVHIAAQKGAMVPGSGVGDKVPAMLEAGEGIINRKAVAAMGGKGAIDAINAAIPRFASGGTVARAAYAAGFRGKTLVRMVAEAKGESGWNERAVGDGGKSKGLWQIHTGFNPWAARLKLFNPFVNARAAYRIFRSQGVGAWHANHAPHMGAAARAVASLRGGRGGRGRTPRRPDNRIFTMGGGRFGQQRASSLVAEEFGKGRPFNSGIAPRVIEPATADQLTGDPGGTSEPSGPSPAEQLAEHVKELSEQVAGLTAETAKANAFSESVTAINAREALRFMGDMVSGQLGTQATQRGRTPNGGQNARY